LHSEDLHDLYCSSNITRVIILRTVRWARNVARMGQWRGAYMSFVETAEEKRLHGRSRCKWEDNFKTYLKDIGWERVDWADLAQVRTSVQLLSRRQRTFRFHKIHGVS